MHNFKHTANAKYKPPFELTKEQKLKYYKMLNKKIDKETTLLIIMIGVIVVIRLLT